MSLFRPSLESSPSAALAEVGVRRTSEILGEAIMDSVSSIRDSLPEQHRAHFETLRQEIINFTKAHGITKKSLAKPDLLREVTSKLSIPDLERLTYLLEHFQYLIVKKEPKEPTDPLEYAEKYYHLKEQYNSQVSFFEQVGILEEGAIRGIDKRTYPIPTLEQIAVRLFERREKLKTKHDQGFTKLLLVPFGMSIEVLADVLKQFLRDYKEVHPSFDLNANNPFFISFSERVDTKGSNVIIYDPLFLDRSHQGQTKTEILNKQRDAEDFFSGWTVHLFQPSDPSDQYSKGFVSIPREGQGTSQGGRPSLEAGKSPSEYFSIFREVQNNSDSPYFLESGLTPMDWIIAFMIHLQETGKPLDNIVNNTESASYLMRSLFPYAVSLSDACWNHTWRRVEIGQSGTNRRSELFGVHTSVMI
ncbi:TPA: hypothetical protein DEP34_04045 [Candidatus Uhrbacteria bacterium]|uniref:Uncharacterized protein n=2 Tax=Candidatus Uhriibacteriota TaxID=1752732 RepID=A0A0G1Q7H4_9BACT|nr:MAG: hypothetical protein UX45_C0012G0040 [Candidatus Uhrbacteria bacterium GW2011_GWF2_46_218]KKU40797.1 MAG: hypothetical protein UX57_C0010G0041 [Candidatus Uhrbacteria bacterium GW2011_GWE2_46_68]HBK34196.1 hypothetical protein [Candidatus Uhrbacteria bacterium]HCB19523.1 hypothetical protein [Candidatus Uhrbacteria bacterium]